MKAAVVEQAVQVTQDQDYFVFANYKKYEPTIPQGYHLGTITGLENLGKRVTKRYGEKDELAFVVRLDETGKTVDVQFNRTVGPNANLRGALTKLGFPPTDERFDLHCIIGTKVEVFVEHIPAKIRGTYRANVDWKDIDLPGRRRRTVPVEITTEGGVQ